MLIIMIATGLTGVFVYYSLLLGLATKELPKNRLYWARCVGANALLLSISATMIAHYFHAELSYFLTLSLWLIFTPALHAGYLVALRLAKQPDVTAPETQNEI